MRRGEQTPTDLRFFLRDDPRDEARQDTSVDLHRFPIPCRLFRLFAFRSLCISPSSPARQQGQRLRVSSLSQPRAARCPRRRCRRARREACGSRRRRRARCRARCRARAPLRRWARYFPRSAARPRTTRSSPRSLACFQAARSGSRSMLHSRTVRSIFLTPGPRALPHIPATRRALPLANRALRSNTLPRRRPSLPLNLMLIVVIAVHHALTIRHGKQHRRLQMRKSCMLLKKCP